MPPHLTSILLPYNLLGNMGPAIVKPVLCLDLDPWARAPLLSNFKTKMETQLFYFSPLIAIINKLDSRRVLSVGPILSGGGVPPLPSPIKS